MKKHLRKSEFKDYLAVDIVDENGKIISTPIYLTTGKSGIIKAKDDEQGKWLKTEIVFDGEKLKLKDIDPNSEWQGLEYEAKPSDLLDSEQFKY